MEVRQGHISLHKTKKKSSDHSMIQTLDQQVRSLLLYRLTFDTRWGRVVSYYGDPKVCKVLCIQCQD